MLLAPGCASKESSASEGTDNSAPKQPLPDPGSTSDQGPGSNSAETNPETSPEGKATPKQSPKESEEDAGEASENEPSPKFDMGEIPEKSKPKEGDDCDCDDKADLIYLWGSDKHIWRYNPSAKEGEGFEDLGNPGCEIPLGQHPFSMGVDRQAKAWLSIRSSGTLFTFDPKTPGSCKETTHKPGTEGFTLFGMAFVEHPNDGRCDQLYLHSFDGTTPSEGEGSGKLGVMDPETLKIKTIGPINFNGGELTGTGDGRLFAFSGKPGRLIEYDAKTAKIVKEVDLGSLELSSSFAFAFWGGDFYFFTDSLGTIPIQSKITKLDYTGDGSVKTLGKAPLRVVGAGVSICAPLEEPPPQ